MQFYLFHISLFSEKSIIRECKAGCDKGLFFIPQLDTCYKYRIVGIGINIIFELHIIFPIPKVFASVSESVAICR